MLHPILAAIILALAVYQAQARESITWRDWSEAEFSKAASERKFVILDLKAVWCHWCHVMDRETYADPKVVALIEKNYVAIKVDQDAHPDLSSRYGDWGWPATIIFKADGTELAKRRGYIPSDRMASLLQAIIDDPTPGPSVTASEDIEPALSPYLNEDSRARLIKLLDDTFDAQNGGWGSVHKFIDTLSMDWTLSEAERGDAKAAKAARQTLDSALLLIDREAGGMYQYSDAADWRSPHFEKIMWYQAHGLRQYALAYVLFKEPKYLEAAREIHRYLTRVLRSPDGAFFSSQDADVDQHLTGKQYYKMPMAERVKLGRQPRVDTSIYARENGWAITGLVALANATGDKHVLAEAVGAAEWVLKNRAIDGGGFRHGDTDRGGPYIGDTLAFGQAALDLYAATGDRRWLEVAMEAGKFLGKFKDDAGGFFTSLEAEGASGVLAKPHTSLEEQILIARFTASLAHYTGDSASKALAEHALKYAASRAILSRGRPLPGLLIADRELTTPPTHITIVGRKTDTEAQRLHLAARNFPSAFKRIDWWDKSEGPLVNPDITYPELERAAAFACGNKLCSLPAFSVAELADAVQQVARHSRAAQQQ